MIIFIMSRANSLQNCGHNNRRVAPSAGLAGLLLQQDQGTASATATVHLDDGNFEEAAAEDMPVLGTHTLTDGRTDGQQTD